MATPIRHLQPAWGDHSTDSQGNGVTLGGQRGLCFGVDSQGRPPSVAAVKALRADADPPEMRKLAVFDQLEWHRLQALLVSAGLLICEPDTHHISVNIARTAAMLALTAVHDVMKLEELCPTVL